MNNNSGIKISLDNNELVIKGNKDDLLELASYITTVAASNNDNDHLHLDTSTLIDDKSNIDNLIIEKEN